MPKTAATDLLYRSAGELAGLVRSGEVTARELVEAALARIDERNPDLNAFVAVDGERALEAAGAIGRGDDRPFAGVPIAIKENKAVAGMRLSFASDFLGDFTPGHDAAVVRRLREAGFVIVGMTNLPEMGILPVSESRRFGPARNPWDTERTPGGSSGGAGAAVAGGIVPIAHGNDGGGSIRIPAACCGLVGLKPARGRVSMAPELGESFLATDGVLTRTVEDTARVLDLIAGPELGDASWAPSPPEPFADTAAREPGRLRIAFSTKPPIEADVDPICEQATRDAAALLASLGHDVEELDPPWAIPGLLELFSAAFGPAIATNVQFGAMVAGREPTEEDLEPLTRYIWERSSQLNAHQFLSAQYQLEAFTRAVVVATAAYDAVLTPGLAQRQVRIGEIDSCSDDPAGTFAASGRFTPFTAVSNASGQPAISLPLYHGDDGLPTAVQLIGRPAGEGQLLALAAQVEAASPWAQRMAPAG